MTASIPPSSTTSIILVKAPLAGSENPAPQPDQEKTAHQVTVIDRRAQGDEGSQPVSDQGGPLQLQCLDEGPDPIGVVVDVRTGGGGGPEPGQIHRDEPAAQWRRHQVEGISVGEQGVEDQTNGS